MRSTFSHHFDAVTLSKFHLNNDKHKRSSSFQSSSKYKRDSRSQSFQIAGYNHNKIRSRANRKLLNNKQSMTVSPNINMVKIKFDGTSIGHKNGLKPVRKNLTIGTLNKKSMKTQNTLKNKESVSIKIGIKGNRLNKKNESLITKRIECIVNNCVEAKWTLPFVMLNFNNYHILKVLYHPKTRANPGWFHRFLNSQQNIDLNTALHITAINGDLDICTILITFSVLINVLNNEHKTALDLALQANNYEIAELLLKHKAIPGPSYYNLNSKYESKLSLTLRSLLHKYLDTSNRNNISEAMRLYEKPLAFRHQFYSESSVDLLSCFGSEVDSAPTSSRNNGYNDRDNKFKLDCGFFNSFVDF